MALPPVVVAVVDVRHPVGLNVLLFLLPVFALLHAEDAVVLQMGRQRPIGEPQVGGVGAPEELAPLEPTQPPQCISGGEKVTNTETSNHALLVPIFCYFRIWFR